MDSICKVRKIIREAAVDGLFAVIDTAEAEIEKIIKEEVKKEVKKASDAAYNFGVSIGVAQGRHEAAIESKLQKDVAETSFARWERESKEMAETLLKEEGLN